MSERIQKIDSVKFTPKQSYSSQNLPQKQISQINLGKDIVEFQGKHNKQPKSKIKKLAYHAAAFIVAGMATAGIILGHKKAKINKINPIFSDFCNSTKYDEAISRFDFDKFGKEGIPLKYSRNEFLEDIKNTLNSVPPQKRTELQEKFDLVIRETGYNPVGIELERIPIIPKILGKTEAEQKIAQIINRFTQKNEVLIDDKETKTVLDSIIKVFPEFTAMIGRKQHDTHHFSVDIHTLKNLKSNILSPKYKDLDNESKLVLKYSTILHDLGKDFIGDITPDKGHAKKSYEITKQIMKNFDLPESIKKRIINQVKNHHWFEYYNKGETTAQEVVDIFGSKSDLTIAQIMAKSDFANVNPLFHYKCMNIAPEPQIYDDILEEKFLPLDEIINKTAK